MFRDIMYYYNQGILKILGFVFLILLPVQMFFYGWIYYFYQLDLDSIEYILNLYIFILMFIVTQKPFMYLYQHLKNNEELEFKEMLKSFVSSFGFIFFSAFILFTLSYVGTMLFIIPGAIVITFVFFLPFYKESLYNMKKLVSRAWKFYIRHIASIYGDILLWASVNILIWAVFMNAVAMFEINLLTSTIVKIIINIFLFPFIYFYLTEKYENLEEKLGE
ncbi:hypothetical protein [Bacillus sp. PS06]|uniref:hypothetical protein n=1 Tax=Bacillus sp. PS06 TaxID=2764176 RepID=UPI001786E58C|nr:hypothetical protein [Bacillus sp. PS06]MBD8071141.1 hypothetical protein [Bacillus sp. PS06]